MLGGVLWLVERSRLFISWRIRLGPLGAERKLKGTWPDANAQTFLAIEETSPTSSCGIYVLVAHGYTSLMHGAPVRSLVTQQMLGFCARVGVVI